MVELDFRTRMGSKRRVNNAPADTDFCVTMLPQVSRTFALSIEALPECLRAAVRVAYLLCRIVDTIEDDAALQPAMREALFDRFDRLIADPTAVSTEFEVLAVASLADRGADAQLCAGAGRVLRSLARLPDKQRQSIAPLVQEMSGGMRSYARQRDARGAAFIVDVQDLERYCYFVAGTVGLMLTHLFLHEFAQPPEVAEQLRRRAVPFGNALQLVNICKDVADDAARGTCFLPMHDLTHRGVQWPHLLHSSAREAVLQVVRLVCARAREHVARAQEYVALWSPKSAGAVRLFTLVPLLLARRTLDLVEAGGIDVAAFGRNPKVSRVQVLEVLEQAQRAAIDDAALRQLWTTF